MSKKNILTLASASPRRRELLALGAWMFHIRPVDIDETPFSEEAPRRYVLRIATQKALAAAEDRRADTIILAADTTVADGDAILGKPADADEAFEMLHKLRGRVHQVHTAIAVLGPGMDEPLVDLCSTDVPMRDYSELEMRAYINSGDPFDKAGGYAIQHAGFSPVEGMQGCFASVMGLPLCHVARLLKRIDIPARADVPAVCQDFLQYGCPVYSQILSGEDSDL